MYIVIETTNGKGNFTHFIEISKENVEKDIRYLFKHIIYFKDIKIQKVYFSNTKLTNW